MKLDKVFLAFLNSDKEEHLLYKKDKGIYIDLNTKKKISENDIDFNTMIYFKDSIDTYVDNSFKWYIKKLYNEDRTKLIDIQNLCIADIKIVVNLQRIFLGNKKTLCEWNAQYISKTLLKEVLSGYRDFRTNIEYKDEHDYFMSENDIYVETSKNSNFKYLREMYPGMKSMEKRKLLRLQYDVMNNNKIN